jgi:hypothetical protein
MVEIVATANRGAVGGDAIASRAAMPGRQPNKRLENGRSREAYDIVSRQRTSGPEEASMTVASPPAEPFRLTGPGPQHGRSPMTLSSDDISMHMEIRQTLPAYAHGVDLGDLNADLGFYLPEATDNHDNAWKGAGHESVTWLIDLYTRARDGGFPAAGPRSVGPTDPAVALLEG